MREKKKVMSAIQPTGSMHLGNYFGAIKNWVDLQEDYDCVYGVVDYHAMTMPYDVKKLRNQTWDIIIDLMAVGVKPENLFVQSLIPEHTELCWIFNCFCSYGELQRMTQFKDKSSKLDTSSKDAFVSAGLLDYPVLQVADILLYKADYVPVGKDQEQHLELTRNIAQRFNHMVGKEYFVLPETKYSETPKIKSPADPTRKMSKSAGEKHWISVFEEEPLLRKKIRSAVTDTGDTPSDVMSPGVENLFQMIKAAGRTDLHDEQLATFKDGNLRYSDLKDATAEALVPMINNFRERREELKANKKEIKYQIKQSSESIRKQAQVTLKEVKELTGLLNIKY